MDALDDLLAALLEAPEAEWPTRLESLCAAHRADAPELRRRFAVLRRFGITHAASAGEDEMLPRRFGDLELLERLGGGGMGVVYRARDPRLDRDVAVKLVRPEHLWFAGASERFRREIAAVARLDHPAIVTVHATGAVDGIAFLVMERVVGVSLAEAVHRLAGRAPARLSGADLAAVVGAAADASTRFQGSWVAVCLRIAHDVALALAHAHARGVVHRDVKPANVMLTPAGRVVLLDFGLALAPGTDRMTRVGAQLGSLPYMAPEQVRGDHAAVDARSDVYSLGVLLYELLTLVSPHDATSAEATRRSILDGTRVPARVRNPGVPADVACLLDKALDIDPRRRYQHAADLAQDLDNALHDRDVSARPTRAALRALRWGRRNPGWAVGIVLGLLLLGGVPTGTALGIASQRGRAQAAEQLARVNAYTASIAAAQLALPAGDAATARRLLDACPEDLRGFEWHHLHLSLDGSVMKLEGATQPIRAVALAADLRCVAAGGEAGEVCAWELPSGRLCYRDAAFGEPVGSLRVSADGQALIVAGQTGRLRCVAWATGAVVADGAAPAVFGPVAIAVDGASIWRNDGAWHVTELDARTCQPLRAVALQHEARAPGDLFLCTATRLLDLRGERHTLWDLATGRVCARPARLDRSITCAALDLRGRVVAVGGRAGRIRVLEMATGTHVRDFVAGNTDVRSLAFTADGEALVSVAADRAVRVWDVAEGALVTTLHGHDDDVTCVASAGSQGVIATGSADRTVRLWSAFAGHHRADLALHSGVIQRLAVTPDGRHLVSASQDGTARIWDVDGVRPGAAVPGHPHHVNCVDVAPDGERMLTSFHNRLNWQQVGTGILQGGLRVGDSRFLVAARFLDRERVVTVNDKGVVEVVNLATLATEGTWQGHTTITRALDLMPDRAGAVTGCDRGRICVWDLVGRRLLRTLSEAGDPVRSLRVRRDGRTLLGAEGRTVRIRDLATGVTQVEVRLPSDVLAVDETDGGQRIVAGLADGSVVLLRPDDGSVLWRLQIHTGGTKAIACDPNGRWLAAGGADGTVVILRSQRAVQPSILDPGHFAMGQAALRIQGQLTRNSGLASALRQLTRRVDLPEPLRARVQQLIGYRGEQFHFDASLLNGLLDQDLHGHPTLDELAEVVMRTYPNGSAALALWHLRAHRLTEALAMADRLLAAEIDWRRDWSYALLPVRAIALARLGRDADARAALAQARECPQVEPSSRAAAAQLLAEAESAVAHPEGR